tara:strand:- start:340 stop:813 length:474 start_codon:yes stop_codon:yes gene_type:complete
MAASLTASGLVMPASQSASGTANVLDDYEEGLHQVTPDSAGGTITLNTSYDDLAYTKIGRCVLLNGQITIASVDSTPTSCKFSIPFTSASGFCFRTGGSALTHEVDSDTGALDVTPYIDHDQSWIRWLQSMDNGSWGETDARGGDQYYTHVFYCAAA